MSAEKIIQQIKKDAEKEVKEIIKEAEKQEKHIINESKKQAEIEAETIISDGKKQSENLRKIILSKANQDFKREIMIAREKIIEECFLKAHHKLSTLNEREYNDFVTFLIKEGCKKFGNECKVIISRDADKKIAESMGLEVIGIIDASGGVILQSKDRKITLNNTFDGILKREKNKIRIKIGKMLFSK